MIGFHKPQAWINDGTQIYPKDLTKNVGIGTTTPQSKLAVTTGLAVGANYATTNLAPTNGAIFEGNVAIGRTAASASLDIESSTGITLLVRGNSATTAGSYKLTAISTTGQAMRVEADSLTSGTGIFTRTSSASATGNLIFHQVSNAAASAAVLKLDNAGTGDNLFVDKNNSGNAINIDGDANSASDLVGLNINVANAGAGAAYAIAVEAGNTGILTLTPNASLTINGSQSIKRTDAGAADYNPSIATTDYSITADNSAATRNIIISSEDVASGTTANPRIFVVHDYYGSASSFSLTVTLEGGGTINGQASKVLSNDYDSITLSIDGTNATII